jgi:REP element-mobilizing transposase RayT
VFSAKGRTNQIPAELQSRLWAYFATLGRNHGIPVLRAGGTANHLHALIMLPSTMSLAKAVQLLKGSSSKWMNGTVGKNFSWQEGYAAFAVSTSQAPQVIAYIDSQALHHAKRTFDAEFLELLKKNGVPFDREYALG